MRDEIVKAHAFRGDRHRFQAVGHGIPPGTFLVARVPAQAESF
jgi:hypothetical protein